VTPETLEALKASIAKWERNAEIDDLERANLGPSSCPLCVLFYRGDCHGCPVFNFDIDHHRCGFTPYDAAESAYSAGHIAGFHLAARAEVAFLKSLLPPEEQQP